MTGAGALPRGRVVSRKLSVIAFHPVLPKTSSGRFRRIRFRQEFRRVRDRRVTQSTSGLDADAGNDRFRQKMEPPPNWSARFVRLRQLLETLRHLFEIPPLT